eukprot:5813283-Pyramimonas_sp.AAC.1
MSTRVSQWVVLSSATADTPDQGYRIVFLLGPPLKALESFSNMPLRRTFLPPWCTPLGMA